MDCTMPLCCSQVWLDVFSHQAGCPWKCSTCNACILLELPLPRSFADGFKVRVLRLLGLGHCNLEHCEKLWYQQCRCLDNYIPSWIVLFFLNLYLKKKGGMLVLCWSSHITVRSIKINTQCYGFSIAARLFHFYFKVPTVLSMICNHSVLHSVLLRLLRRLCCGPKLFFFSFSPPKNNQTRWMWMCTCSHTNTQCSCSSVYSTV